MAREEFNCLAYSGIMSSRTKQVSRTMASSQVAPESGSMNCANSQWAATMMPLTAQYSGCMMAEPMSPRPIIVRRRFNSFTS